MLTRRGKMKTDKRTTKGVRGTAVARLRSVLRSPIWLLIALGLMAWVSHPAEGMERQQRRRRKHHNIIKIDQKNPTTYLTDEDKKYLDTSTHNEKMKLINHFQRQIPGINDTGSDKNKKQEIAHLLTSIMNIKLSASRWDISLGRLDEEWKKFEKPKKPDTDTLKKKLHQLQDDLLQQFKQHNLFTIEEADRPIILEALDYLGFPKKASVVEVKAYNEWDSIDWIVLEDDDEEVKLPCHDERIEKEAAGPYIKHFSVERLQQFAKVFHSLFPDAKSEKQKALREEQILLLLKSATVLNSADLKNKEEELMKIATTITMMNKLLQSIKGTGGEKKEKEMRTVNETYLEDQEEALHQLTKECNQVNLEASEAEKKIELTRKVIRYYLAILMAADKSLTCQDKDEDESLPKGRWEELRSDDPNKHTIFDLDMAISEAGDCDVVHTGIRSVTLNEDTKRAVNAYLKKVERSPACGSCPGVQVERGEMGDHTTYSKKWWLEKYYNFYYKKKDPNSKLRSRTKLADFAAHRRKSNHDGLKHDNFPKIDEVASGFRDNFTEKERKDTNLIVEEFKSVLQKQPQWKELQNIPNPALLDFGKSYIDALGEVYRATALTNKLVKPQKVSEGKEDEDKTKSNGDSHQSVHGQPDVGMHSWERGITCFSILSVVTVICILLTMLFFLKSRRGPQNGHVELRGAR